MVFAINSTRNQYFALQCLLTQLLSTQPNIEKIYVLCEDDIKINNDKIQVINVTNYEFTKNKYNSNQYSYMALARCYFSSILPQEDKVIYLDTDLVIYNSLQELWDLDLTNYALAAVEDTNATNNFQRPFMNSLSHYFNSGVLVMNLKYFREHHIEEKLDELLNNCTWLFPDQDVLNIVCNNQVLILDPKYNSCVVTEIVPNPVICHGIPYKPWDPLSNNLFRHWCQYYLINYQTEQPKYGYSYNYGKDEVKDFLITMLAPDAKILDVGAGGGTYYKLLGPQYNWTAVEVWKESAEYIKQFYNIVYQIDIRDFQYQEDYDLIIFGDVLEHLSVEDAKKVLQNATEHAKSILVAVPYCLPQDALNGNEAERHLQPDLTHDLFNQRYPGFDCIWRNQYYGYYWKGN